MRVRDLILGTGLVLAIACGPEPETAPRFTNAEAIVPPQCYTDTEGRFNPCYTCHQNHAEKRPNTMQDANLQVAYAFSDIGLTNHWTNLFRDFTEPVAAMSDETIDRWVETENYTALSGELRARGWRGFIPDLGDLHLGAEAFGGDGFARDGSGWVAFNYKPLPSTFWPLNGSADDVMIRLPEVFRTTTTGEASRLIYRINLAVVESAIKDEATVFLSLDEQGLGRDLNGDGAFGEISSFPRPDHYLGGADEVAVTPFLYPEGTQFLHSVRYLEVTEDGRVVGAPRMKELRYMRKIRFLSPEALAHRYYVEKREKLDGELPIFTMLGDRGLDNGFGWEVSGFIEDEQFRLIDLGLSDAEPLQLATGEASYRTIGLVAEPYQRQ